jgi:hypothetical protein
MNQATSFWDSNMAASLAGGGIAIFAAALTLIWTTYYDRYKRALGEHERYCNLMTALLVEIDYIDFCLKEVLEPLRENAAVTKRLNTDFLQTARLQLATISLSSDILGSVTRAFRDVEHCNGMLDRHEDAYSNLDPK